MIVLNRSIQEKLVFVPWYQPMRKNKQLANDKPGSGLKSQQVTMISIGGVIGAGLFVGSSNAIAAAESSERSKNTGEDAYGIKPGACTRSQLACVQTNTR
ncbi:hypothetical protein ABH912_006382 [Pseudomonas sp. BT76 TE3572]|jgi:hypothetical protein